MTRSRILSQLFLTGDDFAAQGPLAMPRDILMVATGEGVLLAFSGLEMLLHIRMRRTAPSTKNYLAQKVNRAEVEKLCLKQIP